MRKYLKLYWVAVGMLILCLGGCGQPDSQANDESISSGESRTAGDEADAGQEGVFDPMVGTMDRAKAVEDITNQRNDALREAEQASY